MQAIVGTHLIVDGYVEDRAKLEPQHVIRVFDALVWALDMQYLQRPVAMRVPLLPSRLGTDEDEGGWSVICQITTSHIALHGWPLRRAFMMDIFSCRPFDIQVAKNTTYNMLGVSEAVTHEIERTGPLPSK